MKTSVFTISDDTVSRSMSLVKSFKNAYKAKRFVRRNLKSNYVVLEDNKVVDSRIYDICAGMEISNDVLEASRFVHSIFRVNKENIEKIVKALEVLATSKVGVFLGGRILQRYLCVKEKGLEGVYNSYVFNKGINAGRWGFEGKITEHSVAGTISDPCIGTYSINHAVYNINGVSLTCEYLNGLRTK